MYIVFLGCFFLVFFTRSIRGLNMRMKRRKNEALVVVVKPSIDRKNSNTGQKFHRISFSHSIYIFSIEIFPYLKKRKKEERREKNNNNNKILGVLYFSLLLSSIESRTLFLSIDVIESLLQIKYKFDQQKKFSI